VKQGCGHSQYVRPRRRWSWLIEFAEAGAWQAARPVGRGLAHRCRVLSRRAGPLLRRAGYADGLRSIATGLAASRSIVTGQAVNVSELGFPLG
jgi:hypothetical protein